MKQIIKLSLALALISTGNTGLMAENAKLSPPSADKTITYAADVQPILDDNCVACHRGSRPKAGLRMDTLAGILKGTKEGKILRPGNSTNSVIVKSITHKTEERDEWMPPVPNEVGAKTLTPEQIALIQTWIDQGAK